MLLIAFTYYHTILLVHIYISQGKSKGDTRKEETH